MSFISSKRPASEGICPAKKMEVDSKGYRYQGNRVPVVRLLHKTQTPNTIEKSLLCLVVMRINGLQLINIRILIHSSSSNRIFVSRTQRRKVTPSRVAEDAIAGSDGKIQPEMGDRAIQYFLEPP